MADKPEGTNRRDPDRPIRLVAWAVFLVMWGGTLLAERYLQVDLRNIQYVAAGLILLGLNAARHFSGIPVSRVTLVIGFLAFFGGLVRQVTGELTIIPILLITAGSFLLTQGIMTLAGRR